MRYRSLVIILSLSVILICGAAYTLNFWDSEISSETEKWGAFSDYLNPFVALANLIVVFWLSLAVYNYNRRKDIQDEIFKKALERPVLVSNSTFNVNIEPQETWSITNIGKGVALNLKICFKVHRANDWRYPPIKCFSLAHKDSIQLTWASNIDVISIIYQDIFGNKYVTICADDESYTQPLNEEYNEIKIENFKFSREIILKIDSEKAQRIHWARLYGKQHFES